MPEANEMSPVETKPTSENYGAVGCLLIVGIASFIAFQNCRRLVYKVEVQNSFNALLMALHDYHDEHGHFPPARAVDDQGNVHSWRSLLTGEFVGYSQGEPWDSPANREVSCGWQYTFNRSGYSCLAIIGDSTVWPKEGHSSVNEIIDGTSNTILVLLIKDANVGWWEPRDLAFDGKKLTIEGDPNRPVKLEGGLYGLADGSVRWIDEAGDQFVEHLPALLGKDDRTPIERL